MQTRTLAFVALMTFFSSLPLHAQDTPHDQAGDQIRNSRDPFSNSTDSVKQDGAAKLQHPGVPFRVPAGLTAEERIFHILKQPSEVHSIGAKLKDVCEDISLRHKLPLIFDTKAMKEANISTSAQVVMSLKGVELRNALRFLLCHHGLSYIVRDEMLVITTKEIADAYTYQRVYVLPGEFAAKSDRVIEVLRKTLIPNTWATNGGPHSVAALDDLLVVNANASVHQAMEMWMGRMILARQSRKRTKDAAEVPAKS